MAALQDDETEPISVIIPTLNDDLIDKVVGRVLTETQDFPAEIIVVGRDDARRVPRDARVTFVETPQPVGAARARNIGIDSAKGSWLFFVDADCLVQPGWARALAARLLKGEAIVGGGIITPTDEYWMLVYNLSMLYEFLSGNPEGTKPYLPTLNLAVRREVVEKIGLMDEALMRGQDMDWTIRMALGGFRLYFDPLALVEHRPQKSGVKQVWKTWYKGGYYNIQNRMKYAAYYGTPKLLSSSFLMRWLSPLVGFYTTVRMFSKAPSLLRHLRTLPMVYLTKVAWCLGAAQALQETNPPGAEAIK